MSRYCLWREDDPSVGDSGSFSELRDYDGTYLGDRPAVGGLLRVGSTYARSMSNWDWWQTSLIVEILEDSGDRVRFKTLNSIYIWTKE